MKARDMLSKFIARNDARTAERTLLAQTPWDEGVYIAPDGTLMRLERTGERWHASACVAVMGDCSCPDVPLYRLLPIEGGGDRA